MKNFFEDVFSNVVGGVVYAGLAIILGILFVWLRKFFITPPKKRTPPPEKPKPEPYSDPTFPDSATSLRERARWLQSQNNHKALDNLAFLQPGDSINGLKLTQKVGGGRTTVVWEACSEDLGGKVAVKFLRGGMAKDVSSVEQFKSSAKLLQLFRSKSVAGVLSQTQAWPTSRGPLTYFYVLGFCEGQPLKDFALEHPEQRTEVVRALAKLACELDLAHEQGVVFRDLTPADLMVDGVRLANGAVQNAVRLMDFDSVAEEATQAHQLAITLGYSAPEAFEDPDHVDRRADIFSLAKMIAYVYHGGPLPNAYTASSTEIINLLNCPARIKQLLIRATSHDKTQRPESMRAFSEELEAALQKGTHALAFATIVHERRKIYPLVAQAALGTTLAIVLTRSALWVSPGVHLSDTPWVAVFHGVIGSLMWGSFHTIFFLLYLILVRNRYGSRPAMAALLGATGGLLAGLVVAVPSVLVTHSPTLVCLGWIIRPDGVDLANIPPLTRMTSAIKHTGMIWSYPLTGLLTGIGVALCLNRAISIAIEASSSGSGVLPVPTKDDAMPRAARWKSLATVLGTWQSHLYLATPVIFALLAVFILHPHIPTDAELALLNPADPSRPLIQECLANPESLLNSFGEGINHYLGAIGLVIGFLYRIPLIKPNWR
jgi:serine/threonine protein kinase